MVKRGAEKQTASPEKRAKVAGGRSVLKSVRLVKSLIENEDFKCSPLETPTSVREMLVEALPEMFREQKKEGRHAFQTNLIEMVGVHLAGVQVSLDNALKESMAFCENANATRISLEATIENANSALEAAENVIEERQVALGAEQSSLAEGKRLVKETEKGCLSKTKTHEKAVQEQEDLKALHQTHFLVLKDSHEGKKPKQLQALFKALERQLRGNNIDDSLFEAASTALLMAPETRGEFDNVAIAEVSTSFDKVLSEGDQKVADLAAEVTTQEGVKANAETQLQAIEEKISNAKESVASAKRDQKECTRSLASAEQALVDHDLKVKDITKEKKQAESNLKYFSEVMAAFNFLDKGPEEQPEDQPEDPSEMTTNTNDKQQLKDEKDALGKSPTPFRRRMEEDELAAVPTAA